MSKPRSWHSPAIIIKRTDMGEADRAVTLLSLSHGKIICLAKGARKMKSSQRGFLEPGMLINGYFITTKSWPLLTQVKIQHEFASSRQTLPKIRQLSQVLEILDKLFVEEEIDSDTFLLVTKIIAAIDADHPAYAKQQLATLLDMLGYPTPSQEGVQNITELVSKITNQKLVSWAYLKT